VRRICRFSSIGFDPETPAMGKFRPHKGGLPAQKLTHPRMIAPPESPGFGRADLITLGTSEYAIVSAIPGGFWDVSGVRVIGHQET
jgi:hypothetical protein